MTTEAMVAEKPEKETRPCLACRPAEVWTTKTLQQTEGPDDAPGLSVANAPANYRGVS